MTKLGKIIAFSSLASVMAGGILNAIWILHSRQALLVCIGVDAIPSTLLRNYPFTARGDSNE